MALFVLGITGRRGAGKDTTAQYLSKKYGFNTLNFTDDVLAPMLRSMGKRVTRKNLIELAMDMRETFNSKAVLAAFLCERIGRDGYWVISGVRFPEEVRYFKSELGGKFKLISVECSAKKRYERLKKRGTKGEGKMSYTEFLRIEEKPTEKEIGKVMRMANFKLDNNKSKNDLYRQIDKIYKKFKLE